MTDFTRTSKPKLSAVLIVQNEAHCLEKCLRSIRSIADEIVVIDSGSTDTTVAIARSFGAHVEVSDWPGFGAQKNRALSRASGEWVLALDADEHVTRELAASIREAIALREPTANGFFIQFLATWCGKPVRFGDWAGKKHLRLFRRGFARFSYDPVHERIICQPPYGTLDGLMIHDTVATEAEAAEKCQRYADLSASVLAAKGRGGLISSLSHSAWTFMRGFLIKGGIIDRAVGWKVALSCTKGTFLRYRIAGKMLTSVRNNRSSVRDMSIVVTGGLSASSHLAERLAVQGCALLLEGGGANLSLCLSYA